MLKFSRFDTGFGYTIISFLKSKFPTFSEVVLFLEIMSFFGSKITVSRADLVPSYPHLLQMGHLLEKFDR